MKLGGIDLCIGHRTLPYKISIKSCPKSRNSLLHIASILNTQQKGFIIIPTIYLSTCPLHSFPLGHPPDQRVRNPVVEKIYFLLRSAILIANIYHGYYIRRQLKMQCAPINCNIHLICKGICVHRQCHNYEFLRTYFPLHERKVFMATT